MKAASFWAWSARSVGLFAFCATGCQLIFGSYETLPGPAAVCQVSDTQQCNGATLEVCNGHNWVVKEQCQSSAQCDATQSACLSCAPGSAQCFAAELQRCASDGENWVLAEKCIRSVRCNATTGKCDPCEAGEAVCEGRYLKTCNQTHTDWIVTDCENPNLCNSSTRDCRPCVKGEYQCDGAALQLCNAAQAWEVVETCASGELCKLTQTQSIEQGEDWVPKCVAPGCPKVDAYRCDPANPAQPQSCPASLEGWDNAGDPCYSAELCDPTNGHCKDGCKPGNYRCSGARLERCNTDGTGWITETTCASDALCDAQARDCHACKTGEKSCNGSQLRTCKNTAWVQLDVCSSDELCQASLKLDKCQPPVCSPAGSYRCLEEVLQTCPESQLGWQDVKTCETTGLCDADRKVCQAPVCSVGSHRCSGKVLETCSSDRASWVTVKTCTTTEVCSVTEKTCLNGCPTALTQCNGRVIEECYVDDSQQAKWRTTATQCVTAALCVDGACQNPTCGVGQYRCTGQQLEVCNTERTGFKLDKTCPAGTTCNSVLHQCDICVADTFVCEGSTLKRCEGSGLRLDVKAEDCTRCSVSSDKKTGSCCSLGDTRCSGSNQIQSCSSDGASWKAAADCSDGLGHNYGCIESGSKDYCAKCPVADELECTTDKTGLRQCQSDRSGWSSTCTGCLSCQYGCKEVATGPDVCQTACEPNQTQCEAVGTGTSTTGKNTCAADGSRWLGAQEKCADATSQALCVSGDFSTTQKVACPMDDVCNPDTGACVDCLLSQAASCPTSNTRRYCEDLVWQTEDCKCIEGACVECLPSDTPECVTGGRRFCDNETHTWTTETCSKCLDGACVDCLGTEPAECVSGGRRTCGTDKKWAIQPCPCLGGVCVECLTNDDCTSTEEPSCDTATHVCVATGEPDAGAGAAGNPGTSG